MRLLSITDPPWACAGKHGQMRHISIVSLPCIPIQLCSFLEFPYMFLQRNVSSEGRIEDMFEAEYGLAEDLDTA